MLDPKICSKARLSRDPRFDGTFFTAVKTTKIYCRSICPAIPPKEQNVTYFRSAIDAANAGYRPCLRCRPDSAPGSPAWKGVNTTLERAIRLIHEGALQGNTLGALSERLGVGERYLRHLFSQHLGVSPKAYALYQQCLFAKQLLHQTKIPITQVALASGFNSVRRFNDCFKLQLNITPSDVRRSSEISSGTLHLKLFYRPPYDWPSVNKFFAMRAVDGMEWSDALSYGRTFQWLGSDGQFTASHNEKDHCFDVSIDISDMSNLKPVVNNIRRILDLDVDIQIVQHDLTTHIEEPNFLREGMRLPGVWDTFEAGVRAILGQQVSVTAAVNLLTNLIAQLGTEKNGNRFFPTPENIDKSDLSFLKMPTSRKKTLKNLAHYYLTTETPENPEEWIKLKGIGPWTVSYAKLRGLSDPDVYMGGDLGVKKVESRLGNHFNPESVSPWRSYLTLQLWGLL